jgi:NhaP-type Na+/H+ or K+/H+ antiporter
MYGLFAGIVVGVVIGFIQRDWIRKSLSGEFVHVLNTLTLIVTACVGYAIGRMVDKMGKRRNAEEI